MAAEMEFCLLGPLIVRRHGAAVTVPQGKQRVILAMLLLNAGQVVRVDELADMLWGSGPPPSGPVAVQNYVMRLRNTLGDAGRARIITQPPGYLIHVQAGELDLSRFEALLGAARAAAQDKSWDQAATRAREALALWRGEPLTGAGCESLAARETPRLAEMRLQALELRIDADLHLGRHAAVIAELRHLTGTHPLRERAHGQLMLALYRDGQRAEALAAYRHARDILVTELGVEPGPGLRDLHQQILSAAPTLAAVIDPEPGQRASPAPARRQEPSHRVGHEPARAAAGPVTAGPEGQVPGGDRELLAPGQPGAWASVPRQLPAAAGSFTGRRDELEALSGLAGATAGAVVISAIGGMPGIGKTALAVHAAHRLAGRFPDGQLFIDLHGYTRGHQPRTPGDALDWLLRALEVPAQRIPRDTDGRAALYRQRLAGTRTLIVLDNALSEDQVRPLLPGSAGCLVLVTSRRRLKGLDDARTVALDLLPRADAVTLLRAMAGAGAGAAGDVVLGELAELCGRLPLALRIAAALLRHRPAWTPEHLASLLRGPQPGITALCDGDRDLSTVFGLSYQGLTASQQSIFRHLGLIPGPDIDSYAAAALTGTSPARAGQLLESLVDHNLLLQPVPGRYRLHDLIRAHAGMLAAGGPAHDRQAAAGRLLDYYQHTANHADTLITPYARPAPHGPAPAHPPPLPGQEAAWAWLRAERANLLACLDRAGALQQRERTVALTHGLATLLLTDGPWAEAITLHAAAATAALHLGDRPGRAYALFYLADIRLLTSDLPGAADDLRESLQLSRGLEDRRGQANALNYLGYNSYLAGDLASAGRDLQEALRLYRDLDERLGQANALTRLAQVRKQTGHYPQAAHDLREAWRLGRDLDDRRGQAYALSSLGEVGLLTGDYPGAEHDLHEALRLYQDLGDHNGRGVALACLGKLATATGDYPGAAHYLEAAQDLFGRIGARGNEAWALQQYAAAISATGDHTRALSLYRDALRLAREVNSPDDEAHALEGIAECHLRTGNTEHGVAHHQQALDIFQRLAMTPDADRVQARLKQISAPSA